MLRALKPLLTLSAPALLLALVPAAQSAFFSVGEPQIVWSKKPATISVCWVPELTSTTANFFAEATTITKAASIPSHLLSPPSADEKAAVRALITREFSAKRTGISFTGWHDCRPKNEKAQVYLFSLSARDEFIETLINPALPPIPDGQGSLGQNGVREEYTDIHGVDGAGYRSKNTQKKSYVFLKRWEYSMTRVQPLERLLYNALHEFGHLAGLRHEHIRPEAQDDPYCALTGTDLRTTEHLVPRLTAETFSTYDPYSIMNYCYLHLLEYETGFRFYSKTPEASLPFDSNAPVLDEGVVNHLDPAVGLRTPVADGVHEIQLRIALSTRDQHTLKCLYGVYSPTQKKKLCRPAFSPTF